MGGKGQQTSSASYAPSGNEPWRERFNETRARLRAGATHTSNVGNPQNKLWQPNEAREGGSPSGQGSSSPGLDFSNQAASIASEVMAGAMKGGAIGLATGGVPGALAGAAMGGTKAGLAEEAKIEGEYTISPGTSPTLSTSNPAAKARTGTLSTGYNAFGGGDDSEDDDDTGDDAGYGGYGEGL